MIHFINIAIDSIDNDSFTPFLQISYLCLTQWNENSQMRKIITQQFLVDILLICVLQNFKRVTDLNNVSHLAKIRHITRVFSSGRIQRFQYGVKHFSSRPNISSYAAHINCSLVLFTVCQQLFVFFTLKEFQEKCLRFIQ